MLELFKGQLDLDKIKYDLPYKEALLLREVRMDRLKKEKEDLEKERKEDADRQKAEANRNRIHVSKR
jgi:hypothetical protein